MEAVDISPTPLPTAPSPDSVRLLAMDIAPLLALAVRLPPEMLSVPASPPLLPR
jgi:hypothetical protein